MYKYAKGFTLVELIVSIAILTLLIFGVSSLFSRGLSVVKRSQSITQAANLAQAQVETILSQEYQVVTTGLYEPRHLIQDNFERQTQVTFTNPSTLAPSSNDEGLKRIDITVFYRTPLGEKTFNLSAFIAQH